MSNPAPSRRLIDRTFETHLAKQEAFWQKELKGVLPIPDRLLDLQRPPVQEFIRSSMSLDLDTLLIQRIADLCSSQRVSLFVVLLVAFEAVMARYGSADEAMIGTLSSDSIKQSGHQNMETFVNPICIRMSLIGDPTTEELLKRVHEAVSRAAENRDYPLERLVKLTDNCSHLNRSPIFQAMFILCDGMGYISESPVTEQDLTSAEEYTTRCDLVFVTFRQGNGLRIRCDYDTGLFYPEKIGRMLSHLPVLLKKMIDDPKQQVSRLSLLSEVEQHHMLHEWSTSKTCGHGAYQSIHRIFETQVERTPDAIAVAYDCEWLTYRELNVRANQLAYELLSLDIGPNRLVGLYAERSIELAVAVLGILKAGGAFVPLDTTYPAGRLTSILEDTQVSVIVTQAHMTSRLPQHRSQIVTTTNLGKANNVHPHELAVVVNAEDLAYVMYTSGSTGRPKGVGVTHRTLTNLFSWHAATLGKGMRTLQLASMAFDAAIHEMFAAWYTAGMLVMAPKNVRHDIAGLVMLLDRLAIEKVILPVALVQQLAELPTRGQQLLPRLREVIATGEQLRITQAMRNLFARLPDCRLHNHYGPTETHVVTAYTLPEDPTVWSDWPPIGRPIDNVRIYLLDQHMQPVPIGVPGVLYIGGVCLARGYWRQPALTAARFVPDPFTDGPGEWLYMTGDIAVYLPSGDIRFVGRFDQQVKVRGYRVELEETEAVLNQHPAIQNVTVLAQQETPEDMRLIAFIVFTSGRQPTIAELREFLMMYLPDYMIPNVYVRLDELPLTSNGKVDRSALQASQRNAIQFGTAPDRPLTSVEDRLASIWAELLRIQKDTIGINESFFALGGHSLLGAQLLSRLRNTFEVELTQFDIFDQPTISGIAQIIETLHPAGGIHRSASDSYGENLEEVEL